METAMELSHELKEKLDNCEAGPAAFGELLVACCPHIYIYVCIAIPVPRDSNDQTCLRIWCIHRTATKARETEKQHRGDAEGVWTQTFCCSALLAKYDIHDNLCMN